MQTELITEKQNEFDIRFRRHTDEDVSFIIASWLKSYRISPYCIKVPKEIYYGFYEQKVKDLLERGPNILILCNKDFESQIIGYAVYETDPNILHYLYVKKIYRKLGYTEKILDVLDIQNNQYQYTHYTLYFQPILSKFKDNLIFNPYLF